MRCHAHAMFAAVYARPFKMRSEVGGDGVTNKPDFGERPGCTDQHDNCGSWAGGGECATNPQYMNLYCKLSCGLCHSEDPGVHDEL